MKYPEGSGTPKVCIFIFERMYEKVTVVSPEGGYITSL